MLFFSLKKFFFYIVAVAEEPTLKISPENSNLVVKAGENLVLSCNPVVPDNNLVSVLYWIGPDGERIPDSDR